jgi:hypothetical protein
MSEAVPGKYGKVVIVGTGEVLEIESWDIARPQDVLDASSMSSNGHREKKFGMDDWNGSFTTKKAVDLRGIVAVGSFFTGSAATSSTPAYSGTILISDAGINTPFEELVKWNHTFEGSGACTVHTS